MKVFVIEGLIGAGKSYLLSHLKEIHAHNRQYLFIDEPAHLFQHFREHKVFSLLGKNPQKYAICSQLHIIRALSKYYHEQSQLLDPKQILVTERFHTSPVVFTNALYRQGYLTLFARDLLEDISQEYSARVKLQVEGVYYLATDVDTCLKHIQIRNRPGKVDFVTRHYLDNLSVSYKDYLATISPVKISRQGLNFEDLLADVERFVGLK